MSTNYDPTNDSSPSSDGYRPTKSDPSGYEGLILIVADGDTRLCNCGCEQKLFNPKRDFLQGHDAKLKGKLQRAHVAGYEVTILDGGAAVSASAMKFAKERGWEQFLVNAADKAKAKAKAAKSTKSTKSTKSSKAKAEVEHVTIKVGRWTYEATSVPNTNVYIYTTAKGEQKTIAKSKATLV